MDDGVVLEVRMGEWVAVMDGAFVAVGVFVDAVVAASEVLTVTEATLDEMVGVGVRAPASGVGAPIASGAGSALLSHPAAGATMD